MRRKIQLTPEQLAQQEAEYAEAKRRFANGEGRDIRTLSKEELKRLGFGAKFEEVSTSITE